MPAKLKEAFEVVSKHGPFYTGGNLQWIEANLFCQTESVINVFNLETGTISKVIGSNEEMEEVDTIQTFTTDGNRIVSSHKSGLIKLWNQDGKLEKMWRYIHNGPIAKLVLNGTKLVSGGSDSIIRVWDLQYQACILSLKGCQGVINVVEFHPVENGLFASGDDGKIFYYSLDKGETKIIYDGHFSKVTTVTFANDNKHFISCGRDKVILLWQFNKVTALKTMPVYEAVEAMVNLPVKFKLPGFKSEPGGIYVATGGENGTVKVWDLLKSKEVFVQSNSLVSKAAVEGGLAITRLFYDVIYKRLAVVTVDHNIFIHNLKSFVCLKQFCGFSDEILDITYLGKNHSHIAVATNSNDIKLYESTTMSCQLLKGHSDIVLSLNSCKTDPNLLLSSSKDNTVRLWLLDVDGVRCISVGKRHTGSVGSVAFSQLSSDFFVTASQDMCLKLWNLPQNIENKIKKKEEIILNCSNTAIAHQNEINSVAISPNDKIIASASQDKTVKLWNEKLELFGTLKGHKRGVWCVRFSPADQVVLTTSADCTIKLWSVVNLTCLKTLDGHESSVLRAEFLTKGLQILSAGADGLVKLFNIKNSECQTTMDQHEGRIWALAVNNEETEFITGASDSNMIRWKDVTEEKKQQQQKELEETELEEQKLNNYLQKDNLLKALKLALKLNKPLQTLKIIQNVIKKGDTGLSQTIKSLRNDQKESLMKCALNWNTNSRNCHPAQLVLNILIHELQAQEFRPVGLNAFIEGALPYTDRHLNRITQLMQDIKFVGYTLNCMQPHATSLNIDE